VRSIGLETSSVIMQRICVLLMIVMFALNTWGQSSQPAANASRTNLIIDGKGWLKADAEERFGFINGAVDCLTWTAHQKGFNGTPEQLADKISNYYKAHPEATDLTVIDVWARVAPQSDTNRTPEGRGETWKNAHWYLNGDWWGQINRSEARGYLEGYLWCIDNRVIPKTESFSQSVSFYQKKIDSYIDAHPNSGREAVAIILSKFCDKPAGGLAN